MQNQSERIEKPAVVILAAGKSTRMGTPKFMLNFNSTCTFLEKIIEDYRIFGCKEIITVLNPESVKILNKTRSEIVDYEQITINPFPEKEKLLSVQIGLKAIKNNVMAFIHPVDNPYVNHFVLSRLLEKSNVGDYQIPDYKGKGGHPILISGKIIEKIKNLENAELNLKLFLSGFEQCRVDVNFKNILLNINKKEDYFFFSNNKQAGS
jgi:CTP:molybdopterin cytidylyltransferase MocA